MKEPLNQFLMQEMTRKQFLQLLAGGIIGLFGFSNLIALIMRTNKVAQNPPHDSDRHGFGSRKFGA